MSSILESPELCRALSPFLSSHDLAQCARLSIVCHRVWFPYLWRHIEFGDFRMYLPDLFPDFHQNGIPHPPPGSSVPRERRHSPQVEKEMALAAEAATAAYLSRIQSPPYEQLLRYGHFIQSMTIHIDESDGPYASRYTNEEILEKLKGQVRRRVFNTLIEMTGFNLRALEIKGFNTIQPDRPQIMGCGTAALRRSVQRAEQWALDKVVASLITTAARIASSSATDTSAHTATPTETSVTGNSPDNYNSDREPKTYSSSKRRGLRFLSLSGMLGVSNHTIGAITEAFSTDDSTMEHVDIQCCGNFVSEHIHILLESLPTLQYLDVRCRELESGVEFLRLEAYSGLRSKANSSELRSSPPWPGHHPRQQQVQDPTKPPLDVWACADSLRVLRIGVTASWDFDTDPFAVLEPGTTPSGNAQTDSEEVQEGTAESIQEHAVGYVTWCHTATLPCRKETALEGLDWFFAKIGTLTRLQELSLVNVQPLYFRSRPMQLHSGCQLRALERWEGLKELTVLDLEGFQVSKGPSKFLETDEILGDEEIAYLSGQWPKLKVIKGLVHADDLDEETSFGSSHSTPKSKTLQWLRLTRPEIQIPVSKHRRRTWIHRWENDGDRQVARVLSGYN